MFGYVCDDNLRTRLNAAGLNYWDVYLQEINEQLGIRGQRLSLPELENINVLQRLKILMVGCQSGENLSASARNTLEHWVQNGGILIGFGLQNLDKVFGIRCKSTIRQAPDDYTVSGYFDLREHRLTRAVHSPLAPEQKLVVVSDIRCVALNDAEEIGRLYDADGKRARGD
ncbi:MAG: hypothetical protein Q7J98_09895 [Kiritimatiellia bacterium]|nr:hypothetical protein [Kiritimatiellia bacterium]